MKNRKKGISKLFMLIGSLLLAGALMLTVYNIREEYRAGQEAEAILQKLAKEREILEEKDNSEGKPDYMLNPNMEMPVIEIDGHDYIGTLEIPKIAAALPVQSEWSYPRLKVSPCRYTGSVYTDSLVIAAHNYRTHFGALKTLEPGDEFLFTDVDGNTFNYQIVSIEILEPTAIEDMITGDWDLTLFTCTYGGRTRLTIRGERVNVNERSEING